MGWSIEDPWYPFCPRIWGWTCPFQDCRYEQVCQLKPREYKYNSRVCNNCHRNRFDREDQLIRPKYDFITPFWWIDFDILIEQAIHRMKLAISLVRYLVDLQFSTQSIFPGTIRPPCTTMPWTIWPSLVVLWGVCWMFCDNPIRNEFQACRRPHYDIGEAQIELTEPLLWEFPAVEPLLGFNTQESEPFGGDLGSLRISSELSAEIDSGIVLNETANVPWTGRLTASAAPIEGRLWDEIVDVHNNNGDEDFSWTFHRSSPDPATSFSQELQLPHDGHDLTARVLNCSELSLSSNPKTTSNCQLDAKSSSDDNGDAANNLQETTSVNHPTEKNHSFRCSKCQKAISGNWELSRHMRDVHKEGERFYCPKHQCKFSETGEKKGFARIYKLREHVKSRHPDVTLDLPEQHSHSREKPDAPRVTKRARVSLCQSSVAQSAEEDKEEIKRLRILVKALEEEKMAIVQKQEQEKEMWKEEKRDLIQRHERDMEEWKQDKKYWRKIVDCFSSDMGRKQPPATSDRLDT